MSYPSFLRTCLVCALASLCLPLADQAADAHAQDHQDLRRQAEQVLGQPVTDADLLRLLRASGLTPSQVRDRLQRAGLPRAAADPYLAVLEGRADRVPEDTDPMPLLQALVELRAAEGVEDGTGGETLGRLPSPRDTLAVPGIPTGAAGRHARESPERRAAREDRARPDPEPGPPIFGRELFRRATSQFVPVTAGPVPADYRVGPGDELVLVLTGDLEQAYRLTVTREGWIVIPDVGRVHVAGRSLGQLDALLFDRLGQAYSGIRRGPEATTFFDVSLGKLRTNQVFVIGEVEEPGAYQLSSLATALTALYWAGGPSRAGSFREIRVNRGGQMVRRIDLYDYLLRGDASRDLRLEQGDIVFVAPAERRIQVDGAVHRTGLYELREGETLADAIRYAGGLQAEADLRRVQVERILPPEERTDGRDRAVLDFSMGTVEEAAAVPLRAGDRVNVFAVLGETRNRVTVAGGVWRPGTYGVEDGLRLWDLIERAGGLLPDAHRGRVQIQRLEEDYTRTMIPVSLARGADGAPLENPVLEGMDQLFIFAERHLRDDRVVSIGGWVREPGVYPYAEGMTVRDLVLKAGGVRTGAYLGHADVSRVVISQARNDTLTRRYQVPLDSSYVFNGGTRPGGLAEAAPGEVGRLAGAGAAAERTGAGADPRSAGAAPEFRLESLDAVHIRKAPGFEPQQNVILSGEVMLSGPYSLKTRNERLIDVIERAGGLTPEAYPQGLQLWRADPGGENDTLTAAQIAGRAFGDTLSAEERVRLEEAGEVRERLRPIDPRLQRTRVGIDFVQAMRNPEGPENVLVEPNDSIFVPRHIPVVQVQGAVGLETQVLYRRGAGLGYYIDQAGGYADDADRSRTRVRYANGEVRTRGKGFLFFGGGVPNPDPGSLITVPERQPKERGGLRVTEWVGILTSVATAAATVIIATR